MTSSCIALNTKERMTISCTFF